MAGSSVSNGDGKVHKVYAKAQTRQAAVMAHLHSAGVATSAIIKLSLVLATEFCVAATQPMVAVAPGII